MSAERTLPPRSRVVRRLNFGGDNFEADLENFINLTNEVVQSYSDKYNFDFTNEIAYLGRYLWSRPERGVGWVSMEVIDKINSNEMTPRRSRTVAAAEMTPTHSTAAAAAADRAPLKKIDMPRDDKTSEKMEMSGDDKTSKKMEMSGDDKTSKKRNMPIDDETSENPKSHVKKRLIME